jgi:hypothetical protein
MRRALTSPIVIAGESALPEPALRQRTLIIKLAHDGLGPLEPPSQVRCAKAKFEALPLLDFNGGFYLHVRTKDIPALWREEAARARQLLELPSDERKGLGPITALVGLRLFANFLPPASPNDVAKTLAGGLDAGEEPSLIRLFTVTVFKLIQSRVLRKGQDFVFDSSDPKHCFYLNPPLVFNKLASHFQKEHSDMPTSEDALREALRMESQQRGGKGIVKSMREGKRFGDSSGKAIVLNLDKINEEIGISVDQWEDVTSGLPD